MSEKLRKLQSLTPEAPTRCCVRVDIQLTSAKIFPRLKLVVFICHAVSRKGAGPFVNDKISTLFPGRSIKSNRDRTTDVSGMLSSGFRVVGRCEDEIRMVVLDDEIRSTGDIISETFKVKAVMHIDGKLSSSCGRLVYCSDGFAVCQ